MANMHLVTGHGGQNHVTAADHGSLNAAILGNGEYVLGRGNKLAATVVSNNCIRIADGDILMQGRHIRLNEGAYVDLTIENGEQGKLRHDLIVCRYTMNSLTGVEEANLVVIKGTAVESNPQDPEYTSADIITDHAFQADMPLYRVPLDGLNVGDLVPLFSENCGIATHKHDASDIVSGVLPIEHGGTGATDAATARRALGAIAATEKGAANGVATLGADGRIPEGQLPPAAPISHAAQHATGGSDPISPASISAFPAPTWFSNPPPDLNTVLTTGIYLPSASNTCTPERNFPALMGGTLKVEAAPNGTGAMQTYYGYTGTSDFVRIFTRHYYKGNDYWSPWIEIHSTYTIKSGTSTLTAGQTALLNGHIYYQYT